MTPSDLERLRADTPACQRLTHFNNAGASLMPEPVYQAVIDYLTQERNQGGYETARAMADQLDAFYPTFAELLNAQPSEIAYIENATRAWDMAVYALPLNEGDRVLVHDSEYASNYLALLQLARQRGIHIDRVSSDQHGQIDVEKLEAMIQPQSKVIALTHAPSQSGLVNPAAVVGEIAKRHKLIYVLDACQSVGQMCLDVKKIGCDILSGTGRKFLRGPRGTGFLYVRQQLLETLHPPFIDLHAAHWTSQTNYQLRDDARRFENWESYCAGKYALTEAARYAQAIGLKNIEHRVIGLANTLRQQLSQLSGVSLHDKGQQLSGIVTFSKIGSSAQQMANWLEAQGINVSVTLADNARLDFEARQLDAVVRASVHYFNTEIEIVNFCRKVGVYQ